MEHITAEQWVAINNIVKVLHACDLRVLPETVTAKLAGIVTYSHSMYHSSVMSGDALYSFNYGSIDLPEDHIKHYQEEYEGIDYINWFADEATPRVFRDTDIIPAPIRENSQLMKGWMEPYNIFYSLGMTIAANSCPYGNIYLFRSKEEGDFTDGEVEILRIINEHLCIRYAVARPQGLSDYVVSNTSTLLAKKHQLTERESAIIACIGTGCLRKDLPSTLFVSENTLKKHLSNIYRKLGINHYEELMQFIKANNLQQ